MLTWINEKWSSAIWPILKLLAAVWILVSILGYFTGIQIGFIIIPFFIAGIWAMQVAVPYFKPITSTPKAVMLFSLVYIVVALTAYTVGKHTLLGAYDDWAVFDRTIFGAIRIFAPYIVLTLGSIFFAVVFPQMKWPKRLVALSMVIVAICLMLHGIVEAYDKWAAVYLEKTAQTIEVDRLNMMKELGLMVRPKSSEVKIYKEDSATLLFEATTNLDPAVRYPYLEKEGERKDGMHTLICVMLPDSNREFTRKSPMGWVRNREVAVEPPHPSEKFKVVFQATYAGTGFDETTGSEHFVPTVRFGEIIQPEDRIRLETSGELRVYWGGYWQTFQDKFETVCPRAYATGTLWIEAANGKIVKLTVEREK